MLSVDEQAELTELNEKFQGLIKRFWNIKTDVAAFSIEERRRMADLVNKVKAGASSPSFSGPFDHLPEQH